MIKKKATRGTTTEENSKKRGSTGAKKETSPAEVRKKISKIVESKAVEMTKAVLGVTEDHKTKDGKTKGGVPKELPLATVKYLFEVAGVYPPSTDGSQASAEEDSLAKTLLHRLNLPEEPIARDEEDESESVEKPVAGLGKACGAEPEGEEESKDPVLV